MQMLPSPSGHSSSFWGALRLKNAVGDHLEQGAQAGLIAQAIGPLGCWSCEPLPVRCTQSQPLAERVVGITLHGQAPSLKGVASSPPPPLSPGPPCSTSPHPHPTGLQRAT